MIQFADSVGVIQVYSQVVRPCKLGTSYWVLFD